MNFFKKLITKNQPISKEIKAIEVMEHQNLTSDELLKDLFVDQKAPDLPRSKNEQKGNKLAYFLDEDYTSTGYRDGYSFHSADILTQKLKSLKSRFRMLVDEQIEIIRKDILDKSDYKIETEGLSSRSTRRIEQVIENCRETIIKLEGEKQLSIEEEGLVMKVINEYREGFIRGNDDYQTEKLFGSNTGMFI